MSQKFSKHLQNFDVLRDQLLEKLKRLLQEGASQNEINKVKEQIRRIDSGEV